MYALKDKGRFAFSCAAETPKEFDEKVQQAYWRWRGIQPRGTAASIDEFLSGYEQVKVTLESYNVGMRGAEAALSPEAPLNAGVGGAVVPAPTFENRKD